jgi:lysylphosphatidylglycerol synthetase-like protein (DUF2156 family)
MALLPATDMQWPWRTSRAADVDERVRAVHALPAPGRRGWALFPLAGAATVMLLLGLRGLTLPRLPRRGAMDGTARDLARRLFDVSGANGVGYFASYGATAGEVDLWTDPQERGVVVFRVVGTTALVVGDPLATPVDLPAVLDGFVAHCRTHGWTPAFYQTLAETLPHYRARGLRALAIGCEAMIDLPSFTLSGKRMANVRHSVTHAERAGLRVQLYDADELDAAIRADLRAISDAWLAVKGGGELGFTMGRLGPPSGPSPRARVAIAYGPQGQAQAFITVVPAGGGRGWMLDLMRRRPAESGTMDLLIARSAEALREEGYALLSLSLAPLASGEDAVAVEDAPRPVRLGRRLLYEKMDAAYCYRSLFTYKKKFGVRWETRYLVYAGDAALPAALYAVVHAHLPSPGCTLERLPGGRGKRWLGIRARTA